MNDNSVWLSQADDADPHILRTRPIDTTMKLPMLFHPDDEEEFDEGVYLDEDGRPTRKRPYPEKKWFDVPIPVFGPIANLEDPQEPSDFERPTEYITDPIDDHNHEVNTEYELDSDDEEFLTGFNETLERDASGPKKKRKRAVITEDAFEGYMDLFEREYFFRKIQTKLPIRFLDPVDHMVCALCELSIEEDQDVHICSTCSLSWHSSCYPIVSGTPEHPECVQCADQEENHKCIYCGSSERMLCKEVISRQTMWFHPYCARLNKTQADLKSPRKRGTAKATVLVLKESPHECILCDNPWGVVRQCAATENGQQCPRFMHSRCCHKYCLVMEPNADEPVHYYCLRHSVEKSDESDLVSFLSAVELTEEEQENLKEVVSTAQRGLNGELRFIEPIYKYWIKKRQLVGFELVPRLHKMAKWRVKYERVTSQLEKNSGDMSRMKQLRQSLEKIRILVDMCKKREAYKKHMVEFTIRAMEALNTHLFAPEGPKKVRKKVEVEPVKPTHSEEPKVMTPEPRPKPSRVQPRRGRLTDDMETDLPQEEAMETDRQIPMSTRKLSMILATPRRSLRRAAMATDEVASQDVAENTVPLEVVPGEEYGEAEAEEYEEAEAEEYEEAEAEEYEEAEAEEYEEAEAEEYEEAEAEEYEEAEEADDNAEPEEYAEADDQAEDVQVEEEYEEAEEAEEANEPDHEEAEEYEAEEYEEAEAEEYEEAAEEEEVNVAEEETLPNGYPHKSTRRKAQAYTEPTEELPVRLRKRVSEPQPRRSRRLEDEYVPNARPQVRRSRRFQEEEEEVAEPPEETYVEEKPRTRKGQVEEEEVIPHQRREAQVEKGVVRRGRGKPESQPTTPREVPETPRRSGRREKEEKSNLELEPEPVLSPSKRRK